jgi:hypothetical protein
MEVQMKRALLFGEEDRQGSNSPRRAIRHI